MEKAISETSTPANLEKDKKSKNHAKSKEKKGEKSKEKKKG